MTNKQKLNKQKQDFLLTFFDSEEKYQEKYVHGFWLIKSINGNTGKPFVSLYSKESYKGYKNPGGQLNFNKEL